MGAVRVIAKQSRRGAIRVPGGDLAKMVAAPKTTGGRGPTCAVCPYCCPDPFQWRREVEVQVVLLGVADGDGDKIMA